MDTPGRREGGAFPSSCYLVFLRYLHSRDFSAGSGPRWGFVPVVGKGGRGDIIGKARNELML